METRTRREPLLTTLLIYPTSCCNLKCRHCYFAPTYEAQPGNRADEISYAQICRAIDDLLPFGLDVCKLSGGEPFLREDVLGICCYADCRGIGLIIETNGTLVKEYQAGVLAQLRRKPFVSVSIDGATAETHDALRGVAGSFEAALQGLAHLVGAGLNVQVIAAAYEGNKGEFPQIIDLAAAKGAKSFKVCFVNPVGRARNLPVINRSEAVDLDAQLMAHARQAGIRYCSSVPVGLKSAKEIIDSCALSGRCNVNSTLGLLADGTITICGMGRYTPDFRFGQLGQDDLATVWATHPTLQLIRDGVPSKLGGVCGRCVARTACLGHCRIDNENVTLQTFFDPFATCAEMESLGRFPKSRIIERPLPAVGRVA
jgi:SynChlorMet cassette radical SAM/SPASM protein ScmF